MLKNHITETLNSDLEYVPTKGQARLIEVLADFTASNSEQLLIVKGYAGTGKTTLIGAFIKTLQKMRLRSVLMAPTGRAAKVLTGYAGKAAFTIHKKIYRQKSSSDGFGNFLLDKNLHSSTFFIVDEASMISNFTGQFSVFGTGNLLSDLIKYVYNDKNCKLILVGDDAQLPPVGLDKSPALNKDIMQQFGYKTLESHLNEVVRQTAYSGILQNATTIRKMLFDEVFSYPKIKIKGFDDIFRITGQELIEELSSCYDRYGLRETIVVSRSNKRANRFNMGIRNQILFREEIISEGDLLMVVKNNYFWNKEYEELDFIANGDIVEITRIQNLEDQFGYRYANVSLRFIDYDNIEMDAKIMLDTLEIDTASLPSEKNKKLFFEIEKDYLEIKQKKKRYLAVREDQYFNALQVKFAYAVTCHKAQGGQWKAVFIDQGYLTEDLINLEFLRWLYTAFTRATEKLFLVNFSREFFDEE